MRIWISAFLSGCLSILLAGCGGSSGEGQAGRKQFVSIGTGSQTGVYYPTGQAIASLVNKKQDKYGVNVSVESTGGSVFNVNAMLAGDMQFGIVQSDIQYQACHGQGEWADKGPRKNLRAVFSIHPELVTLVAADDAGIRHLANLKDKRVNLDSPGSGTRQNAMQILQAVGIDVDRDLHAEQLRASEGPSLLQDDRIDAFFFTVAHPNGALKEAAAGTRKVRFVPIDDPAIDGLIRQSPYLAKSHIPIKFYEQAVNERDVPTIGVKATLMTTTEVSADTVYAVTREVFENLEAFKQLHEAYTVLTRENMLDGLSAPLHPGAERYFKEADLLP